jgi:hypothetical protein
MAQKLSELPDGTGVRFDHLESTGFRYIGEVQDGKIVDPNGDKRAPAGAAREIDQILRGEDARSGWSPSDWKWFSGDGWEELKTE